MLNSLGCYFFLPFLDFSFLRFEVILIHLPHNPLRDVPWLYLDSVRESSNALQNISYLLSLGFITIHKIPRELTPTKLTRKAYHEPYGIVKLLFLDS